MKIAALFASALVVSWSVAASPAVVKCEKDCLDKEASAYEQGYRDAVHDTIYTTPHYKAKGSWLVGPAFNYFDGPAVGAAGGYQFVNPKAPTILGTVTYGKVDGGSVTGQVHKCYGTLAYGSENTVGVGVSLLWRVGR